MKFSISSSLFYLLLWTCISLACSHTSIAQHKVDSTDFFEKVLLNPTQNSHLEAALKYYKIEYLEALKRQDTLTAVRKLRFMSIGQAKMGAIYESEMTAIDALHLLDNLPTTPWTIGAKRGVYNDLGKVYRNLKSPTKALHYYEKALRTSENASDSILFINNKGNVFSDMENYEMAQKEFVMAHKISITLSNDLFRATALDNLGFAQSKALHPDALSNMLQGLEIRLQKNNLQGTYSSYRHLALHYHHRNLNKQALEYAQKAYEIAQTIKSPSYIKNALTNLLKIKNDPEAKLYIKLSDSIEHAKLNMQNKYAAMQYDIQKEQEKTEANRLLQEEEKRKKQAFQLIGFFLIIALVAYYFIQKALNKRKVQQQVYRTETRISKKVHDEVANDVYHLMNKIQLNTLDDDALLDDLEEIYKKTRDISKENGDLTIYEDFNEQLTDLIQSYHTAGTVITIQNISKINWKTSSDLRKTSIYRILQELMTNMKKHSHSTFVLLSFEQNKNKIQVKYRDNGVGCQLKNKNGLQNMESRIEAINGSVTFDTEPQEGFKATIII